MFVINIPILLVQLLLYTILQTVSSNALHYLQIIVLFYDRKAATIKRNFCILSPHIPRFSKIDARKHL